MECSIKYYSIVGTSYEHETIVQRRFEEMTELSNGQTGRGIECEQKWQNYKPSHHVVCLISRSADSGLSALEVPT